MKQLLILYLILISSFISCNKNNNENNNLNKKTMSKEIINTVNKYKEKPNYSIQIDKGGCRVELLGNELPFYNVFHKGGFSSLVPFNANIIKSGIQTLTIKVYPDEGKTNLDDYTQCTIKVMYFENDKNKIEVGRVIEEFKIPKEIIEKKIPFFETKLTFNANVPYDFSSLIDKMQDLSKIPDLESKVLAKYNKIIEWLNEKNTAKIANFRRKTDEKLCLVFYCDNEKDVNEMFNYSSLFEDNKKADELQNYKMAFYFNNRLVRLERLDNKEDVITLSGKTDDGYETTSDLSILLWIPKGETEFRNY